MSVGVAPPAATDRRLYFALPLAIVAVQLVWGGVDLLLAAALDRIEGTAVTTYGWITGIASACALLVYPLAGAASDRTPRHFGRRSAWVVLGAAGSTLGLLALGQTRSVGGMGLAYVLAFASLPLIIVALYASIPDRIPRSRRGAIGALVGAATILGGVAGNVLAARFADRIEIGAAVFAAVVVAGAVLFVVIGAERRSVVPNPSITAGEAPPARTTARTADFLWFSIGRFALFLGYAAVTGLAYYVFRDHIGQADPANGVAAFAVVTGGTTFVSSLVAGVWSDRLKRRKPFVVAGGAILGLGLLVPLVSPTAPAFLAAAAIIGVGFGAYLAVGTALGTLVLPSTERSGRDLGFMGLANASAQAVAPILGSSAAATFGYPVLFVAAALACLVGTLAVLPIRSVR